MGYAQFINRQQIMLVLNERSTKMFGLHTLFLWMFGRIHFKIFVCWAGYICGIMLNDNTDNVTSRPRMSYIISLHCKPYFIALSVYLQAPSG